MPVHRAGSHLMKFSQNKQTFPTPQLPSTLRMTIQPPHPCSHTPNLRPLEGTPKDITIEPRIKIAGPGVACLQCLEHRPNGPWQHGGDNSTTKILHPRKVNGWFTWEYGPPGEEEKSSSKTIIFAGSMSIFRGCTVYIPQELTASLPPPKTMLARWSGFCLEGR